MVSSRSALTAAAAAALFACGCGLTVAAGRGLYATCAALTLLALWVGAAWAWNGRPAGTGRRRVAPPSALEQAEAELRVLANLLDQAPAPMLTLHADGGVRAANRAARRMFAAEDRLVDPPAALVEALTPGEGHARRLTVDLGHAGRPQTYAMSVTDFVGPRGVRRLAVLLDIQPELHAAEAAALRELMGVLSHEIMNGLTPIASLAATAAELLDAPDGREPALAREAVRTLARRSEGLRRFVASYRALERLPPPNPRPTSLGRLVEDAATLFCARWGEQVRLVAAPPSPDVIAAVDEEQVQRALANLLTNAAEAAVAGAATPPTVTLDVRSDGQGVVLNVADNGPGVAADARSRVFQPFFTTKPSGAGVGLSLARQIARAHGGDLELMQTTGAGATFEMRLA